MGGGGGMGRGLVYSITGCANQFVRILVSNDHAKPTRRNRSEKSDDNNRTGRFWKGGG